MIENDYNNFGKEEKLVIVLISLFGIIGMDNYIHEISKNVIVFLSVLAMFSLYDLSKLDHFKKMILIALSASTSLGFAILWIIGEIINNEIQNYQKHKEELKYKEHLNTLAKILPYNGYIFRLTSDGKIRSYKRDNPKYKQESDKEYKKRITLVKKETKEIFKIK